MIIACSRALVCTAVLAHCLFQVAWAAPGPLAESDVPGPLKAWVPWVLHEADHRACPPLLNNAGFVCGWMGELTLSLDEKGGRFTTSVDVYEVGLYPLPGNAEAGDTGPVRWPLEVTINGKRAAVVAQQGRPHVQLQKGRQAIAGRFAWDSLPEALQVPPSVGLVQLEVKGKAIPYPQRTPDGRIFLARAEVSDETDSLDITIHRKLQDGVPVRLITRLTLAVAGKSREVVLGRALPDGFEPLEIQSALPVEVKPDGRLVLQVRRGQWMVELHAHNVRNVQATTRPAPDGLWKLGEEVWVFEPAPEIRAVTVEGVVPIDPQQTTLPDEWRSFAAFAVEPGQTITLTTRQRGNANPQPDRLQLDRELWLDFDGSGFTARDTISGTFSRSWRLAMAPPARPGRISVNDEDRFITKMPDSALWGTEVRSHDARITAESRIPRETTTLSAVSWAHDFDRLSMNVHLPPGWRLFAGMGADGVEGSWVQAWSLLDLFLLLITALAVYRLFGWRMGVLALAALLLSLNEPAAPAWIWLLLVVAEALVRVVPEGRLMLLPWLLRAGCGLALVVILVPFAVTDIRRALHPAAEEGVGVQSDARFVQMLESSAGGQAKMAPEGPPLSAPADMAEEADAASPREKRHLARTMSPPVQNAISAYDKSVVVQTGPGVPAWRWNVVTLSFNGPVQADQKLTLWLLPPWFTSFLALLRQGLLVALVLLMFRARRRVSRSWAPALPASAAALPLALVLSMPLPVRADEVGNLSPSPTILEELKQRLLAPPACAPACATLDRLAIDATPQSLRLRFDVSALERTGVPVPGQHDSWMPAEVRVNGKPAQGLYRDDSGVLWVVVDEGTAKLELEGPWPPRSSFALTLPLRPKSTALTTRAVQVEGLAEDGQVADSLQFSREAATAEEGRGENQEAARGLVPLLEVQRQIDFNLRWTVTTSVRRLGSAAIPVVTEVPLLPGEAVTTPGVRLSANQSVAINFGARDAEFSWTSTLPISASLSLKAPLASKPYVERWQIQVAPIWHVEAEGIPEVRHEAGDRTRVWSPWPEEALRLSITRPAGVEGQTLTIETSHLDLRPGPRTTAATLTFTARTSRGREHIIDLPAGADVQSLKINGRHEVVRQQDKGNARLITLPLSPGMNDVSMDLQLKEGQSLAYGAPEIRLNTPHANASVHVNLEQARRWVLWVWGRGLGPTVFFWSHLAVLVGLGWVLARMSLAPLRAFDWVLLGLGVMQLDVWACVLVAGFFLALGWRARLQRPRRAWAYDATQLLFLTWALVAIGVVFSAIQMGLLASPNMRVMGNGSSDSNLNWYVDRGRNGLPQPFVLSVPLLVYRIAMMAWALWLALAVLRWSRWVWRAFSWGGILLPLRLPRRKAKPVVMTTPPEGGAVPP